MKQVQIICTKPGMRRNGMTHPASAFYVADFWTEDEIKAFRGDPAFEVRLTDGEAESGLTPDDFRIAVDAEVERILSDKTIELHAGIDARVLELVQERTMQLNTDATDLGNKLVIGETRIAELETQLAAALAGAPKAVVKK